MHAVYHALKRYVLFSWRSCRRSAAAGGCSIMLLDDRMHPVFHPGCMPWLWLACLLSLMHGRMQRSSVMSWTGEIEPVSDNSGGESCRKAMQMTLSADTLTSDGMRRHLSRNLQEHQISHCKPRKHIAVPIAAYGSLCPNSSAPIIGACFQRCIQHVADKCHLVFLITMPCHMCGTMMLPISCWHYTLVLSNSAAGR